MRVLILGDGLLGSELHRQTGWNIAARNLGNLDITSKFKLKYLLFPYTTVINCIAHTDTYSNDQDKHMEVNYHFPMLLSDICKSYKKKLVHISTEFVYANNSTPATETDLPIPDKTWYAYSKLLADEYIKATNSNSLICRELHKPNPFPYPEVWKVKTSGDTVDKIAEIIIQLVRKKAKGVFNVGTGSKFLKEIANSSTEVPAPFYVPEDTSMDLSKLNNFYAKHNLHS